MKPSGPSSFNADDMPGSSSGGRLEPADVAPREKPIVAKRLGSMARTVRTYPQQDGIVFPRELLEYAIDEAREGYVRTANMGAAFNIMKRKLKDRWTVERGPSGYVFKEHIHPLEPYLRSGAWHEEAHKPRPPMPREKPGVPESAALAEARRRWDAAKTSGDADAMTRTANALLRAVEADRAARGEPPLSATEGGRDPISQVLAPEQEAKPSAVGDLAGAAGQAVADGAAAAVAAALGEVPADEEGAAAQGIDVHEVAAEISEDWRDVGDWLSLSEHADAELPSTDLLPGHSLADEVLKRAAGIIERISPEDREDALNAFASRFGRDQAARVVSLMSSGAHVATTEQWRGLVEGEGSDADVSRSQLVASRATPVDDPLEPPVPPEPKRSVDPRDRRAPLYLDWSESATRARLTRMAREPLSPLALLHLAHEVYRRDLNDANVTDALPAGWRVVATSTEPWMTTADRGSGYYAIAVYHEASQTLIIVNRGTESLKDGFATKDIKSGVWNAQLDAARNFFSLVQTRIGQIERLGMRVRNCVATGHSLGGALAQYQVMLSRNLRPEDIDYRQGAPKFVGVTFSAARARGALEAAVARNFDTTIAVRDGTGRPIVDGFGRPRLRRRRDVYKLLRADSFNDYCVDYTMAGDGIALGDFLGDGTQDVQRAQDNMVGRAVILPGIEMERVEYWRNQYKRWRREEMRLRLGQLNMKNHSLQNFTESRRQLQSPLEAVVGDYRR